MAKSTPSMPEAAATPAPSTSHTARITKSRSEGSRGTRTTRQRSKLLAQASSDGVLQSAGNHLDNELDNEQAAMLDSSEARSYRGKGKGKLVEGGKGMDEDLSSWDILEPEVCPITDKDSRPFPIMELPTEIRLEIYRACLTRPYNILLSKREPPPFVKQDREGSHNGSGTSLQSDEEDRDGSLASTQTHSPRRILSGVRSISTRSTRPTRSTSSLPLTAATPANAGPASTTNGVPLFHSTGSVRNGRRAPTDSRKFNSQPEPERNQTQDPLITNILRTSKEIYKEARSVLYSENHFVLDLNTAMQTLGHLHQRSRRQIKHVELEIPTYNEILERFQETVRLSLRYCSGLKKFIIHMPFTLPGADGSGTTGNTTVYANGFDILRWLPQECDIIIEGNICSEIELVVNKHLHLAKTLDKLAYARRQLISNESSSSSTT